jgi:hypothetical protein
VRASLLLLPLLLASPSKAYGYVWIQEAGRSSTKRSMQCVSAGFYFRKFLIGIFGKRKK